VRFCPADHGIIILADGDPARRRPASGSERLQSAVVIMPLLLLRVVASGSGDGTRRRAILEVMSPDVTSTRLLVGLIREDGRGLGSIDMRC